MYAAVIVPTLKTIVVPLEEESTMDRIEAIRVLAAANVIIMICLGLILTLQVRLLSINKTDFDSCG